MGSFNLTPLVSPYTLIWPYQDYYYDIRSQRHTVNRGLTYAYNGYEPGL